MFWIIGGLQVLTALLHLFSPTPAWLKAQIEHTRWEGFTAWDLIMPLFLFIVGTAMPYSFARRIEVGQSTWALYRKVLSRTAILFVLGMAAQGHLLDADLSQLHIYCNTLQAIACGYLIASIAMFHLRVFGQILLAVLLLAGYWLLILLVPVPGHGAGLWEEKVNLAMYIDEMVLGRFRDGTSYTWILSGMAFVRRCFWACFPVTCSARASPLGRRWAGWWPLAWRAWHWDGPGASLCWVPGGVPSSSTSSPVPWFFGRAAGAICCWLRSTWSSTCSGSESGRSSSS